MFGPPKDVEGECNARLYLGDDYGDNSATFRCQLKLNHIGPHKETFKRRNRPVEITWWEDESYNCPKHGHVREGIYIDSGCPCDKCFEELPDCPDCKGHGYETIGDQYIDCTKCEGCGKIIK
jgi:hypothetical protein